MASNNWRYYLWGKFTNSRTGQQGKCALGGYVTEDEAREDAAKLNLTYYDVHYLNTTDWRKATQILKFREAKETGDVPYALQRVRHKVEP